MWALLEVKAPICLSSRRWIFIFFSAMQLSFADLAVCPRGSHVPSHFFLKVKNVLSNGTKLQGVPENLTSRPTSCNANPCEKYNFLPRAHIQFFH